VNPKVHEALVNVVQAMDVFNGAVDSWIEELRQNGSEPEQVQKLTGAAKAMRDSSSIYLAWADHLAQGMPKEDDADPTSSAQE
jgi:hypothetical protein